MISTKSGRLSLPQVHKAERFNGRIGDRMVMVHKRFETMKCKLAEMKQRLKNKIKQEVLHMVQCCCLGVHGKELIHQYFHVALVGVYQCTVIVHCSESTLGKRLCNVY